MRNLVAHIPVDVNQRCWYDANRNGWNFEGYGFRFFLRSTGDGFETDKVMRNGDCVIGQVRVDEVEMCRVEIMETKITNALLACPELWG